MCCINIQCSVVSVELLYGEFIYRPGIKCVVLIDSSILLVLFNYTLHLYTVLLLMVLYNTTLVSVLRNIVFTKQFYGMVFATTPSGLRNSGLRNIFWTIKKVYIWSPKISFVFTNETYKPNCVCGLYTAYTICTIKKKV